MAIKPVSSIAMALAGQSSSLDIPKPPSVKAAPAAASTDIAVDNNRPLPTPPSSLSPTFAPYTRSHAPPKLVSNHTPPATDWDPTVRSDVDGDAHDQPQALSSAALSGLEAAGAITPALLAREYLPDILVNSGPLAIRHVLGHLTQSVPGFARIPPAKARRLVVGALESRLGGGKHGEVEFEKVGWGKWSAALKDRERPSGSHGGRSGHLHPLAHERDYAASPSPSVPDSYAASNPTDGLRVPRPGRHGHTLRKHLSGGSMAGDSMLSSRDEDHRGMHVADHEADKMSLDGDLSNPSYGRPPIDLPGDVTEEEDWEAMGPEALLRRSAKSVPFRSYNRLSRASGRSRSRGGDHKQSHRHGHHSHRHNSAHHSKSSHHGRSAQPHQDAHNASAPSHNNNAGAVSAGDAHNTAAGQDTQERDAIEALLRMHSM